MGPWVSWTSLSLQAHPHAARYLLNQSHVSKCPLSRIGRFGRRTSGLALFFGLAVQMSLILGVWDLGFAFSALNRAIRRLPAAER